MAFDEDEIDDLTEMRFGDKRTFSLLSLIFAHLDLRQNFHVDHIYPQDLFKRTKLRNQGFSEEEASHLIEISNRLPNLQLLEGHENTRKRTMLPEEWLLESCKNSEAIDHYKNTHLLDDMPSSLKDFESFYEARRLRLREKIGEFLKHVDRV